MALRLAWTEDKEDRHLEGAYHRERRRRRQRRARCTGQPADGLSTPAVGEWRAGLWCVWSAVAFWSCITFNGVCVMDDYDPPLRALGFGV